MLPELERLATLARSAEAKARSQKLEKEAQAAAERLRAAEERVRTATGRQTDELPGWKRAIDEAEKEEKVLNELVHKIVQFRSHLDSESNSEAENQIISARQKIEGKRREARAKVEEISKAVEESKKDLVVARDKYQQVRKELDRLLPEYGDKYQELDRIAAEAETYLPLGQIRNLIDEIESGSAHFQGLDAREQKAQLMIWIGRLRRLQNANAARPHDEVQLLEQIFRRLVNISKQHMPGYIDAFQEGYSADWDLYISDAQEQLRIAAESVRRERAARRDREEAIHLENERKRITREALLAGYDDLRAVISSKNLPEEGLPEFTDVLNRVVSLGGGSDPELHRLLRPYREYIDGAEFRALRKHLDRLQEEDDRVEETAAFRERHQELIGQTRGRRAILIGGAVREEVRKSLQQTFEFDELEWEPFEANRPSMTKSLEQRIANRGIDIVLMLKDFVSHNLSDRIRPICEDSEVPCLYVERGYGASQVAEALRLGLLRAPQPTPTA